MAGVIDPDYTGDIFVLMLNHSDRELAIGKGTPFAQLVPVYTGFPQMHWVPEDEFNFRVLETDRGDHRCGQATDAYLSGKTVRQRSSGNINRLVSHFENLTMSSDSSPEIVNTSQNNQRVKPPIPPKPKHLRAPLSTLFSSSESSFESNTSLTSTKSDGSFNCHKYFTRSKASAFKTASEPEFTVLDKTPSPDLK